MKVIDADKIILSLNDWILQESYDLSPLGGKNCVYRTLSKVMKMIEDAPDVSKDIEIEKRKIKSCNRYMFRTVSCCGYMKKIKDGKYIWHSSEYDDVYYYIDESSMEIKRKVPAEDWGGSNFIKTYYEFTEKKFIGVVVGMRQLTIKAELYCDSATDHNGTEHDYVAKRAVDEMKVAVVAFGCNKTRLVPLEVMALV